MPSEPTTPPRELPSSFPVENPGGAKPIYPNSAVFSALALYWLDQPAKTRRTRAELAVRLGVAPQHISAWLSASDSKHRAPPWEVLGPLAVACGRMIVLLSDRVDLLPLPRRRRAQSAG